MTATEARTPTVRAVVARGRFWAVVLGVLALVAIGGLLANGAGSGGATFGPDNAAPAGGRALAEVLRQQGVRVAVTDRLADARGAAGTLLVDDASSLLTRADWRALAGSTDRLVVVGPGFTALQALAPGTRQAGAPEGGTAAAGCDPALARRAGTVSLADVTRSLRTTTGTACFADEGGGAQLVTVRTGRTRVILLADPVLIDNEHIGRAGNAAVALNALGAEADLTWYRPSPLDLGDTAAPTLQDLTPPWVTPAVVLLLATVLAAALHRGRRLGPLVVERLPVVVRSRETVEWRARLYARAGARLRAADALRIGAVGRMAPVLGLGRAATVEQVAAAAARLTGRPVDAVLDLLLRAEPAGDRDLVRLSDALAGLEAAVRAAAAPGGPNPTNGTP